ncbi:glucose-6-phosphate dehydrogenase [Hyaloraphidium curvatum]|nr:glucose-6-phosphate dehydrogenase [Hyaloraphidium curvatum]
MLHGRISLPSVIVQSCKSVQTSEVDRVNGGGRSAGLLIGAALQTKILRGSAVQAPGPSRCERGILREHLGRNDACRPADDVPGGPIESPRQQLSAQAGFWAGIVTMAASLKASAAQHPEHTPSPGPGGPALPGDESVVRELCRRFVQGVEKKDITWKGQLVKDVFVGAEAVDFLCGAAFADKTISRSDATFIGEQLRRRGLFQHYIYPQHAFADEFNFYRYTPLADEFFNQPAKPEKQISGVEQFLDQLRRPSVAQRVDPGVRIGSDDEVYTIIVLGASGDLAYKKTFPALFGVLSLGFMPKNVKILGYARSKIEHEDFLKRVTSQIKVEAGAEAAMASFKQSMKYITGQYDQADSFKKLESEIEAFESSFPNAHKKNRLFYLALPPSVFADVSKNLKENCYGKSEGWNRIVIEKPFGMDLQSSNELAQAVGKYWSEHEVYRIDHYLGKDMVKNLLVLRFANRFFGNELWNRDCIDNVQITFKEMIGTEGRGGYFDEFGIIRDVMQNHLMQVLCLVAMEKPVTMEGEDIRNEKTKVLKYIPPIQVEDTLLGQYAASADGKMEGYLEDPTVPKGSNTPTFAVSVLYIKNERWDGVPFILKCGKALNDKKAEIRIQFKDVPGNTLFKEIARNELVVRIQPDEAVYMKMMTKTPGYLSEPRISELQLTYSRRYSDIRIPEAYETLMVDILRGDHANFVRSDELEEAWRIFTPLLHAIDAAHPPKEQKGDAAPKVVAPPEGSKAIPVHQYKAGTRGPSGLDDFVGRYGFRTAPIPYEWKADYK